MLNWQQPLKHDSKYKLKFKTFIRTSINTAIKVEYNIYIILYCSNMSVSVSIWLLIFVKKVNFLENCFKSVFILLRLSLTLLVSEKIFLYGFSNVLSRDNIPWIFWSRLISFDSNKFVDPMSSGQGVHIHSSSDNPELETILGSDNFSRIYVWALEITFWWSTIFFSSSAKDNNLLSNESL